MALLLSVVLSVPTVRAQTLSSNGTLNWGITSGGPSTSTVSGTALVIGAATLTLAVAAAGGPAATLALTGRALTVAGSAVAPYALAGIRAALSKPPLTTAMVALLGTLAASGIAYDSSGNLTTNAAPGGDDLGRDWTLSIGSYGTFHGTSASATCAAALPAIKQAQPAYASTLTVGLDTSYQNQYRCNVYKDSSQTFNNILTVYNESFNTCRSGYTLTGGVCVSNSGSRPAADSDVLPALATAGPLAKTWDALGCPAKITTYRDTVSADDPCALIVHVPSATWTPVTVPNGGAVSLPPTTETIKDAAGNVIGTKTTTPTAQVTANTNQATMGASPVTVVPGQTVVNTVKNADGSTTTTTTTTANPSQSTEQTQDGGATFSAGDATLYTKKTRTWADVLGDFKTTLQAAPWMTAAKSFFTVTITAGACPHWVVPASQWTPSLDASQFFCSQTALNVYALAGVVVMIVAAWAAFRIAFL